ncbi:hypothetical protein [uncultured Tenacibaculum sp.]|uniref:hypothetical protein n=1 Tax=uncultured Tenacibaculum sp. TaxID=174713 RepID=UPI002624645D|nr:hypothetical protein [uncultured Tenacibaculum sp.]
MNYGELFVKAYNDKFASLCANAKTQFESYYETNYSFIKAEKLNIKPLVEEIDLTIHSLKIDREIYERCKNVLSWNRNHYKSDITISLINDEVQVAFKELANKNQINVTYKEFLEAFSIRQAIYDYFSFLDNNNKELTKKFNSKKIGDFLNVVKTNRELHTLNNLKKELKKKDESVYHLTQNEKMILLHVLLHEFKDSGLHSLSTEYFRVLSLTSECLTEKDVQKANTNHTKYNYFYKGVNASDKPSFEKIKMIDEILKKLESIKNIEKFKRALVRYKNSK